MSLQKIDATDPLSRSADPVAHNVERLAALFPEAVAEGKVDFEVLRQLLGESIAAPDERFGLHWKGKAEARQLALTPSTGTLRPCPEESVDWDKTQNIFIEGDNLEVLKLLQKGYLGKVKLIYIDPPYNTGNDFVYPDTFADSVGNYLRVTGQITEDGAKITSNTESSGRFHTNWLNMMYPRLKVAKELLSEDGALVISVDDVEHAHLRGVCTDVFGPENFVATFLWEKRTTRENRRVFSFNHDYLVCFARNKSAFEGARNLLPSTDEVRARYSNPDNDPRGPWQSVSLNAQGGHATKDQFYKVTTPNGRVVQPPEGRCWVVTERRFWELAADGRVWFGAEGGNVPREKLFLSEARDGLTPHTLWTATEVGTNDSAKKELIELMGGADVFETPKPVSLLRRLVDVAVKPEDIVMDFFAGSGGLGQAVMEANAQDGGNRQYICVQLPEPLDPADKNQKSAAAFCDSLGKARTIAEITKERLRRAGAKLKAENPLFAGDLGFRVYKLDSSNLKAWDPQPNSLEAQLALGVDHIKPGRTESDLLTELLLKLGLELTVPVEPQTIAGHTVFVVGLGALLAVLSPRIRREEAEPLALGLAALHESLRPASLTDEAPSPKARPARESTTVLFRDAAFEDDVAKANLVAILEQRGLTHLRSL